MGREKILVKLLAVALATPIVGVSLWSIHRTLSDLSDSCAEWGAGSSESTGGVRAGRLTGVIGPNDPCRGKTFHAESKEHAVIVAALVPGGLLLTTLLAVGGAMFSRRVVMLDGAAGILAETFSVFSLAPLTLVVGMSFLYLARRV
jgi:hypothetical protein